MKTALQNSLKKILNTENKQNIAKNSGWLILDHGIRVIFGLLIGAWVARYLGPSDYGKLSYIIALIGLMAPLYLLGLDTTVPKELIYREKDKAKVLGATFALKLAGSVLIFILAPIIAVVLHPGDKIILCLAVFAGLSYIFKSFEALNIWFLNKLQSKYTVIARNSGLVISGLFRVALILGGFSLVYFGVALTLETFIVAIVLGFIFFRKESLFDFKKFKFDFKESLSLLKISWIFLLLGFFNTALLNIDKIMLEKMTGVYEVGLYSTAAMLSYSFIILADYIMLSTYPVLIKLDKDKPFESYAGDFQKLLNYMALLAYAIIIIVALNSHHIVHLLWGKNYELSGQLLSIQIFSILPVFVGLTSLRWLIINNYIKFCTMIFVSGLFISIPLNFYLIKLFGVVGASYAMIITLLWVNVIVYSFSKKTFRIFMMQIKALFMVDIIRTCFSKVKRK